MIVCEFACFREFLIAIMMSVTFGTLYDFTRCFRVKKRIITDCVYVILCILLFTVIWIFLLFGCLRWYVILTVVFGTILYFLTVSRYVFVCLVFLTEKINKIFIFFLKILLTPINFLCKIVVCMDKRGRVPECKRGREHDKDKIQI